MQSKSPNRLDNQVLTSGQLGHWESDDEESEIDSGDEHVSWEKVTVELALPPPSPDDFCELPIRGQFAYVKPVIKAVLNETYLPARERHQAFMQGGSSRIRLLKTATGKGDLSAREVSELGRVLQFWVLGPMRVQKSRPHALEDLRSESGQVCLSTIVNSCPLSRFVQVNFDRCSGGTYTLSTLSHFPEQRKILGPIQNTY